MTSLVQYAYPKRWWSPSCESFLNHLRSFGSSCLCVGVGKKSSLTAQNNLILWGMVPPLRPLLMGSWFWWVLWAVLAVTDHYAVFACLWITRVVTEILYVFVSVFSSGFLFGREPEKPLVVHRADLQTARGSGVWRGDSSPLQSFQSVSFTYQKIPSCAKYNNQALSRFQNCNINYGKE